MSIRAHVVALVLAGLAVGVGRAASGDAFLATTNKDRLRRLGFGAALTRMASERHPPLDPEEDVERIGEGLDEAADRSVRFMAPLEPPPAPRLSPEEFSARLDAILEPPVPTPDPVRSRPVPVPVGSPPPPPRAPSAPVSPDAFAAGLGDLLADIEAGEGSAPGQPPGDSTDPASIEGPGAFERQATGLSDSFSRFSHSLTAGLQDSRYESVPDGNTTTESRYLRHDLVWEKGFGPSVDLVVTNSLTLDKLRTRDNLDLRLGKQFGVEGFGELGGLLEIHRQKLGETEPDYDLREVSVSGGRDAFPNWGWDARIYDRTRDYAIADPFYFDDHAWGGELGLRASESGLDVTFRASLDRERFPDAPENDVNRRLQEWTAATRVYGFDVRYLGLFQREGILLPGLQDPYRQWNQEFVFARRISPVFQFEYTYLTLSRAVDDVSAFLFDAREKGHRRKLSFATGKRLDGALTWSNSGLRNRDKVFTDAIDERADDQDRWDLDVFVHFVFGWVETSFSAYTGRTAYVRGQSAAFADQVRKGYALQATWRILSRLRSDFSLAVDDEKYPAFAINDNDATTTSLSLTWDL